MQPEDRQLDPAGGVVLYDDQGSPGRRTQRAAAAKAIDRGKRVAEMILECNEDGEQVEDDVDDDDGGGDDRQAGGGGGGGGEGLPAVVSRGVVAGALTGFAGEDDGNGSIYRRKPVKTRWSAAEDTKLKEMVDVHGSGNWRLVSSVWTRTWLASQRSKLPGMLCSHIRDVDFFCVFALEGPDQQARARSEEVLFTRHSRLAQRRDAPFFVLFCDPFGPVCCVRVRAFAVKLGYVLPYRPCGRT